jgi:steroid delta-isomerase-like uncharacterized protein
MQAINMAQGYFSAWNRRDPAGIAALFDESGFYCDPVSGEVGGQAIADYAAGLFSAFPDLTFETANIGQMNEHTVAAQWYMRGTNTGPFRGLPPSGKAIDVPGADFIVVVEGGIRSVHGYFDSRVVPEQLGLQVVVQPHRIGPVSFGTASAMPGAKAVRPGAISLTSLQVRSDAEVDEVRGYGRRIYPELAAMPGFISALTASVGHHMVTATAWESPGCSRQMYQSPAHQAAMRSMLQGDFTAGGTSSVWVPASFGMRRVRCTKCNIMGDYDAADGRCACGAQLPEPPPYW